MKYWVVTVCVPLVKGRFVCYPTAELRDDEGEGISLRAHSNTTRKHWGGQKPLFHIIWARRVCKLWLLPPLFNFFSYIYISCHPSPLLIGGVYAEVKVVDIFSSRFTLCLHEDRKLCSSVVSVFIESELHYSCRRETFSPAEAVTTY